MQNLGDLFSIKRNHKIVLNIYPGSRVGCDIVQIIHPSQSHNFINESRISNLKFHFSGEKEMTMTILKGRKVLDKPIHKVFRKVCYNYRYF